MLKEERQQRILELLAADGRVVAADLQAVLGVSGYTVRRDLDELATTRRLQRVHGGALARSTVPHTYAERQVEAVAGKISTARAAATLLEPGQVEMLDGGSTALHLVDAIPAGTRGTLITHSPPVATALAAGRGLEVVLIGGSLDPARWSRWAPRRSRASRASPPTSASSAFGACARRAGSATATTRRRRSARSCSSARTASSGSRRARSSGRSRPTRSRGRGADRSRQEPGVPAPLLAPYAELGLQHPAVARSCPAGSPRGPRSLRGAAEWGRRLSVCCSSAASSWFASAAVFDGASIIVMLRPSWIGTLLDDGELAELLREAVEQQLAALGVRHLAAAEHDRDLTLSVEEADDVALLGVVVVLRDLRAELDLADVICCWCLRAAFCFWACSYLYFE